MLILHKGTSLFFAFCFTGEAEANTKLSRTTRPLSHLFVISSLSISAWTPLKGTLTNSLRQSVVSSHMARPDQLDCGENGLIVSYNCGDRSQYSHWSRFPCRVFGSASSGTCSRLPRFSFPYRQVEITSAIILWTCTDCTVDKTGWYCCTSLATVAVEIVVHVFTVEPVPLEKLAPEYMKLFCPRAVPRS